MSALCRTLMTRGKPEAIFSTLCRILTIQGTRKLTANPAQLMLYKMVHVGHIAIIPDHAESHSALLAHKFPTSSALPGQRPGLRMEVTMRGTFMPESRRVQVLDSEAEAEEQDWPEANVLALCRTLMTQGMKRTTADQLS